MMPVEVLVPPLGQTVDTLVLVSWFKQEGEKVTQGEPLFSVETDKATLDVEAPGSGILTSVTAHPGDEVKVLSAIAVIAAAGEVMARVEGKAEAGQVPAASATSTSRIFVSPRARRLAEQAGVSLASVKATGPQGAIIERDVRAFMTEAQARAALTSTAGPEPGSISPVARRLADERGIDWRSIRGSGPRGQVTREDVEQAAAVGPVPEAVPILAAPAAARTTVPEFGEVIPLAGVRALIAERMVQGHRETAPVTLTAEADATALVQLRRQLAEDGVEVSYNDLFLYLLAHALREHPRVNASLEVDAIKIWNRIDIGLAVDAERGLLVPVMRGVDEKGLAQIAAETKSLTERARAGRCTPEELRGSTFTLTNLGMFGIDAFTPLINLPECAILGVGRIKEQPAVVNGQVAIRQMVWLSLTFDHRLVDGGPAARFLQRVALLVERPQLLMT
jgi:pyruvate dehydrogenase E2 component (dihydrolipoyllysine-residue acetyltransferase)